MKVYVYESASPGLLGCVNWADGSELEHLVDSWHLESLYSDV